MVSFIALAATFLLFLEYGYITEFFVGSGLTRRMKYGS